MAHIPSMLHGTVGVTGWSQWKGEEDEADKEEEDGRQHQGMDRPGVHKVPEGSGEQGKMEKTGCEVTCGAQRPLRLGDRWDEEDKDHK